MALDNEPYLVTLDYAYNSVDRCFYFHCAKEGKKLRFLNANPNVWGQIVEDRGYRVGECNHDYACIEFQGKVEFISNLEEKKQALILMIEQFEKDPDVVKKRLITIPSMDRVFVGKIHILQWSAKKFIPKKG
jgi:nitroimidazol reductase NimA-like FMN-containing flavoprotein (pyridoxamine 5'-phosphate oxidase superfamily)